MKEIEVRTLLSASVQRALLGMIYSSIRAIAVGFEGSAKLKIIYYLDREPNDSDYDSISEVAGEICADIDFKEVEEICIYTKEPIANLNSLNFWAYIRQEN